MRCLWLVDQLMVLTPHAFSHVCGAQAAMQSLQEAASDMKSDLLRRLVTPGELLPDMGVPLAELLEAADWDQAIAQGRIIPTPVRHQTAAAASSLSAFTETPRACQETIPPPHSWPGSARFQCIAYDAWHASKLQCRQC